jgi:putative ABC transport system ATP-binding protein
MLEIAGLHRIGLKPASFTLNHGSCIAVRGPSGAGKTLLLRAIADLDPNEGIVVLDGENRNAIPAPIWRRRVLYMPAQSGWWADSVGAHFADWRLALPLLDELRLPVDSAAWPITRCSTGELARFSLIRALLRDPRVLLLDEPTAALDAATVATVEAILRRRIDMGMSAIWVTHDPAQSARIADRSLLVEAGTVRESCDA